MAVDQVFLSCTASVVVNYLDYQSLRELRQTCLRFRSIVSAEVLDRACERDIALRELELNRGKIIKVSGGLPGCETCRFLTLSLISSTASLMDLMLRDRRAWSGNSARLSLPHAPKHASRDSAPLLLCKHCTANGPTASLQSC